MKIKLKPPKDKRGCTGVFTEAQPFVKNERGLLVHRPRYITHHTNRFGAHLSVHYYCGNAANGALKFSFLDAPGDDDLVCEPCEIRARMAKLPSASEIAGRHVHTGKIRAFQTCCNSTGEHL